MLSMPFNSTSIKGLYCVGDSTFPGQVRTCSGIWWGLAVTCLTARARQRAMACSESVRVSGVCQYCHYDSTWCLMFCDMLQGVNAVVFSGFGCAHR